MKSKPNLFARVSPALAAITILAIAPSLQAATLTWDTTSGDGSTITAGSGTWHLTADNLVWNNAGANPNLAWTQTNTTTPLHTATFAGTDTGTKSITIGADIAATSLTFSNSGYTLFSPETARTIRLNGALSVASGKTATIGSNVTVTRTSTAALDITGGGTLFLQGSGARIIGNSNNLSISSGTTLDVGSGGIFSGPSQIVVGSSGTGGNLLVNGGSVSAGSTGTTSSGAQNIVLHNLTTTGTSELTINGGSVINLGTGRASSGESGLRIGSTTSTIAAVTATVNLNGGSLTVARVYEGNTGSGLNSTFNFNGGTLKVTTGAGNAANFMTGLNNAFVKEGGAIIDTNGVATTIGQLLQHGGEAETDGGLVKKGAGTLTLTANNSYTGKTDVQAGTLTLGRVGGTLLNTAALEVSGGILDVANAETVGAVTLTSGSISGAAALTGTSYTLKSGTVSSELAGAGIILTKNTGGTATLDGTQSYTGATNIDAGMLNVTGSLASAINVGAAGTLTGEGTTSENVVFGAGSSFVFDPTTTAANQYFRSSGNINTTAGATTKININLSPTATSGTGIVVFQGGSITTNGVSDFKLGSRGSLSLTSTQLLFDYTAGSVVWKGGNGTNPTFWDVNSTAQNFTFGGVDDFFFNGDTVTFDDTASSFAVAVQGASVTPGALVFDNSANAYTLSGGAVNGTTLTKSGSNLLTISNVTSFSGGTTISAGTIQLGDGTNATGSLGGAIINNGTLETNHGANPITLSNNISGSGAYSKSGVGTVILTGANSYIGTTTINAGILQVGDNGSAGSLGTGAVVNNGTLIFDRMDAVSANNNVSGTGSITKQRASALTLGGTLEHSGGIAVGAGTLSLGGNNTYTGLTTVSAGAGVIITANNGLGATGVGNETVLLGVGSANSGAIGLSGGITYGAGEKVIGAGLSNTAANGLFAAVQRGIVQSISGDNTFAGDIEISSAGVTRFGTQDGADLTLTGSISRGTGVTGVTALFRPNLSDDWVTVSGTGSNWDNETLIFTGATSGAGGVRLGANDGLSTIATLGAGGNATGSGTTLDLNGFNQTVGGLTSNGTLHIVNNGASPSILTIDSTADWSTAFANNKTTIEDGSGQVSLVKTGAFSQTLVGTHTYTGATTVDDGTLVINGNISTSITNVNDGGTLSGTGTVGALNINDGGTLAIGSSPGTLNVSGNLTLALGSISDFEINAFTSGNFDLALAALDGIQTATFSGGTLNLLFQTGFNTVGTVKIFDFDTYAGAGFTTVSTSGLASGFTASFDASNGIVTVVPEPNAAALLGGLSILLLLRRGRS
jgi:autotransporter-associated beta strand protein